MKIRFLKHEMMLFELLHAAITKKAADTILFKDCTAEDWNKCRSLTIEHGVMALAWEGVMTLPDEYLPPKKLKILWGIAVEEYEKRYFKYCDAAQRLTAFYSQHGIETVVLKGVGLSTCYSTPSHREGGDIDIYTYSADPGKLEHAKANALADQLAMQQGSIVNYESQKHSTFYYRNIPIENHKTFLDIKTNRLAQKVESILHQEITPSPIKLYNDQCIIKIPSPTFNLIFGAFHTLQHCVNGIALHHLCDWAFLTQRYSLVTEQLVNQNYLVDDPYFTDAVNALSECTNLILGTKIKTSGIKNEVVETILFETFRSKYQDRFFLKRTHTHPCDKLKRFVHFIRLRKILFNESYHECFYESFRKCIRSPKKLFDNPIHSN